MNIFGRRPAEARTPKGFHRAFRQGPWTRSKRSAGTHDLAHSIESAEESHFEAKERVNSYWALRDRSTYLAGVFGSVWLAVISAKWWAAGIVYGRSPLWFDFRVYYAALLKVLSHKDPYLPFVVARSFYYHPFALSLLWLTSRGGEAMAAAVWTVAGAIAWVVSVFLSFDATWDDGSSRGRLRGALLLLAFFPAWMTVMIGQVNTIVALLLVACFWLDERGHQGAAGASLALATVLKLTPALLVLYFVVCRRWKGLAALFAALTIFTLVPMVQFSGQLLPEFLHTERLLAGVTLIHKWNQNPASVAALLSHWHTGSASLFAVEKAAVAFAVVLLCIFALRNGRFELPECRLYLFSGLIASMVLASPLMWYHHLSLLVLPIAALLARSGRVVSSFFWIMYGAVQFGQFSAGATLAGDVCTATFPVLLLVWSVAKLAFFESRTLHNAIAPVGARLRPAVAGIDGRK